ncbi:hypothetical protein LCGC14_2897920, partial [marine sediment metagenome]
DFCRSFGQIKENKFNKKEEKMRNKKTIFGTIIFLFAIIGICNTLNVVALDNPQYTETISPGAKLYFNFDLNEGDKLRIDFEVIVGGQKDIKFYILDSAGITVEYYGLYIQGTFYFVAPYEDTFRIYFSNTHSIFTSKTIEISFNIVEYGKSIVILSPKTNDVFVNGYNYIIWTTTGSIDYVQILLYYGNSFVDVIESRTYNDGSYNWYLSSC